MLEQSALERLHNILNLERRQGYRNRAVIGGMEALAERWSRDAQAEGVPPARIEEITARLRRYAEASAQERGPLLEELLALTAAPVEDEGPAPTPEEARATVPDAPGPQPPPPGEIVPEPQVPPPGARPTPRGRPAGARGREKPRPTSTRRAASPLDTPVTRLRGVGPAVAERLARLGIHTYQDLLHHYPRRYEDYSRVVSIGDMVEGETVSVAANLWKMETRKLSRGREMVLALFNDGTGTLRVAFWNRWMAKKLTVGRTYRLSGRVGLFQGYKTLDNPHVEPMDVDALRDGPILPVYPLTEGLTSLQIGRLVAQVIQQSLDAIQDPLPQELRQRYGLRNLATALKQIHLPDSPEQLEAARQRLAFDELFAIQLGMQMRRRRLRQATAPALSSTPELLARFQQALPFALTGAQERVLQEVARDLARTVPMSRLVQGDVGSGKTVVAAGAMYIAAANQAQSALLAPTQILAEQHFRGLTRLLEPLARPDGVPLRLALLTGRVTGREREAILEGLADGSIDIVVGTTALIQEPVAFRNLACVVVDEQHRFGVEQRARLRDKGLEANGQVSHMLVMSATPIPRSLALTLYGDLDVSVIDELPPGRQPVRTKLFRPAERERLYAFLRRRVAEGRQGYIIYPLVDESDRLDVGAAVEAYEFLRTEVFPDLHLGLLHGRMAGPEKDQVMQAFVAGEIQILVATTVVEVGIDVPNATVMMVEDADRFGLAQLHQLRGRVGRGEHPSYCALISKADSPEARARLEALETIHDGFTLAEKDLEMRGPGDFFGVQQSGLPPLRMANLTDMRTLSLAQEAARELLAQDPELTGHPALRSQVETFWRGHGDIS